MTAHRPLPYDAGVERYQAQARALLDALHAGNTEAAWCFRWQHPRFRDRPVSEVHAASLGIEDAQVVVAHEHGFETWADLVAFTDAVRRDGEVAHFERAVEAVISGDVATLRSLLADDPELVRARSVRRHHATLLHYTAANGVEADRQKTPANGLEVARTLLDAGAEVDALADMYDEACTTMSMLVSSSPPAEAGLQTELAELLLDYGAAVEGPGSRWQSAVMTALMFGFRDTAEALAQRGSRTGDIVMAAGLGRVEEVARLCAAADRASRHAALALAAQHGHADVVRLLLEAGEDPDRYNPEGFHSHATPLHQAVWGGHGDTVRLLVEAGARLDIRDTVYQGTPLDWALHGAQEGIAEYLRTAGAPGGSPAADLEPPADHRSAGA